MKINQLFVAPIEEDILKDLLTCFSLNSLTDTTLFSLNDIRKNNGLNYFNSNILERLKLYYLPCKANVYLVNVTESRMITILRQVLKIFDYKLVTSKKTVNKIKTIFYNIEPIGFNKKKVAINSKASTINFD